MAARNQNSYEGCFSSYRINLHYIQTKLTIAAEHRNTKRIYRIEIDQNNVNSITQGVCETCEQLFELLQELIDNDGKDRNKDLKIVEQKTKLILNVTLIMSFGRTSRQFHIKFELEGIQLDDITRLENIINEHAQRLEQLEWSMNDRFDHATKLSSFYNNNFQFQSLSPISNVNLSDNARTISRNTPQQQISPNMPQQQMIISSQDVVVITNQSFVFSINKRYQLIRFNLQWSGPFNFYQILIGIVYQPNNKDWSNITQLSDIWFLDVFNGSIQHSYFGTRPYTWPLNNILQETQQQHSSVTNLNVYQQARKLKRGPFTERRNDFYQEPEQQRNSIAHVDLLVDTHQHCLAFRLQDQTEDRWAFYLPKNIQINQLYPLVVLRSPNISISIDS